MNPVQAARIARIQDARVEIDTRGENAAQQRALRARLASLPFPEQAGDHVREIRTRLANLEHEAEAWA